jgi:hypothetical protein
VAAQEFLTRPPNTPFESPERLLYEAQVYINWVNLSQLPAPLYQLTARLALTLFRMQREIGAITETESGG